MVIRSPTRLLFQVRLSQAPHAFAVSLADAGCIRHNDGFDEAGHGLAAIACSKRRVLHDAVDLAAATSLGRLLFRH